MRAFNHPSSCFESSFLFDRLRFFSTAFYVRREAKLFIQFSHFVVVVAFILTDALGFFLRGRGSLHLNVLECFSNHFHVVTIGSLNRHADRNAVRFSQDASFCSVLPTICRVWTGFFPRPTAPLTLRRPSPARTNPTFQVRHSKAAPVAKTPGRRQLEPTPEIADRLRSKNRCRYHLMNSIDTPCEEHIELRSSRPDPAHADYGNPRDAVCVAEAKAPFDSTMHPECTSRHSLQPNPLLSPPILMEGIGHFHGLLKYALNTRPRIYTERIL
jgi:hypothetical protein